VAGELSPMGNWAAVVTDAGRGAVYFFHDEHNFYNLQHPRIGWHTDFIGVFR